MNQHHYLPHTEADIARMLARCGASSLDDFYSDSSLISVLKSLTTYVPE